MAENQPVGDTPTPGKNRRKRLVRKKLGKSSDFPPSNPRNLALAGMVHFVLLSKDRARPGLQAAPRRDWLEKKEGGAVILNFLFVEVGGGL